MGVFRPNSSVAHRPATTTCGVRFSQPAAFTDREGWRTTGMTNEAALSDHVASFSPPVRCAQQCARVFHGAQERRPERASKSFVMTRIPLRLSEKPSARRAPPRQPAWRAERVGPLSVGSFASLSPAASPVDRQIVARFIPNRLKLFGGAVVDVAGEPITGRAAQRHRIALLALMSTTRRPHRSRDQLVALLWPDADAERGRKLLSDSIYRINQALGGDAITGTGEDIRLNREQIASDVAELEAAVDAHDWRTAVDLYAGSFLDGFFLPDAAEFDQWLET